MVLRRRSSVPLLALCTVVILTFYQCCISAPRISLSSSVDDTQDVQEGIHNLGIDVLILSARFSCVVESTLRGLERFLVPAPKRFIVITTGYQSCEEFQKLQLGTPLQCFHQDEVVPGLTLAGVQAYLDAEGMLARAGIHHSTTTTANNMHEVDNGSKHDVDAAGDKSVAALSARHGGADVAPLPLLGPADPHSRQLYMGRSIAGWYLQQFLKLGTPGSLGWLDERLLVWDADMIPTRRLRVFDAMGRPYVNVGGNVITSYEQASCRLGLGPYRRAPDGSSFVAHNAVVTKRHLAEMLDEIAHAGADAARRDAGGCKVIPPHDKSAADDAAVTDVLSPAAYRKLPSSTPEGPRVTSSLPPWASAILDVAARDPTTLHLGFSEYATYASFMLNRHPDEVTVRAQKTWTRHPLGGYGVVPDATGHCCPTRLVLLLSSLLGNEYTGFEVGHYSYCNISAMTQS
eukprot:jgi/Mesvir1/16209/Mv08468-RA.3